MRREVQYRVNMAAAAWKARKLNEVLPRLQSQFEEALNEGVIVALNPGEHAWINDTLEVDA